MIQWTDACGSHVYISFWVYWTIYYPRAGWGWGRSLLLLAGEAVLELNLPWDWIGEKTLLSMGSKLAHSSGTKSQTDWSSIFCSSTIFHVRRNSNKVDEILWCMCTYHVSTYPCLDQNPSLWVIARNRRLRSSYADPWLINFSNKAHHFTHTTWQNGIHFPSHNESSQYISLLSSPPYPTILYLIPGHMRTFMILDKKIPRLYRRIWNGRSKLIHLCYYRLSRTEFSIFFFFPESPFSKLYFSFFP